MKIKEFDSIISMKMWTSYYVQLIIINYKWHIDATEKDINFILWKYKYEELPKK